MDSNQKVLNVKIREVLFSLFRSVPSHSFIIAPCVCKLLQSSCGCGDATLPVVSVDDFFCMMCQNTFILFSRSTGFASTALHKSEVNPVWLCLALRKCHNFRFVRISI